MLLLLLLFSATETETETRRIRRRHDAKMLQNSASSFLNHLRLGWIRCILPGVALGQADGVALPPRADLADRAVGFVRPLRHHQAFNHLQHLVALSDVVAGLGDDLLHQSADVDRLGVAHRGLDEGEDFFGRKLLLVGLQDGFDQLGSRELWVEGKIVLVLNDDTVLTFFLASLAPVAQLLHLFLMESGLELSLPGSATGSCRMSVAAVSARDADDARDVVEDAVTGSSDGCVDRRGKVLDRLFDGVLERVGVRLGAEKVDARDALAGAAAAHFFRKGARTFEEEEADEPEGFVLHEGRRVVEARDERLVDPFAGVVGLVGGFLDLLGLVIRNAGGTVVFGGSVDKTREGIDGRFDRFRHGGDVLHC